MPLRRDVAAYRSGKLEHAGRPQSGIAEGVSERQQIARGRLRGAHGCVGATFADVLFHVIVERSSAGDWARKKGYGETSGIDFSGTN